MNAAEAFAWFDTPVEKRVPAQAKEIPAWLESLWAQVRERIGAGRFDPVLGEVRAGRFTAGDGTAWVQTNDEQDSGFVNLTLEIESPELSLNLVGWFDPQLEKVETWLRRPQAWRILKEHPEWSLLVFVRKANVGESGRAVFQGAEGRLLERLELAETSPANITTRLTGLRPRLGADEKLALHVRRAWSRPEAEAPDLVERLAQEVGYWLDPLGEIRTV